MATKNERKNRAYWLGRQNEINNAVWKSEEKIEKELKEIYEKAVKRLEKELQAFYGRYATKKGISIQDARKRISKSDLADFDKVIAEKLRNRSRLTQKQIEQYELMRAKFTVTRLDMLINELELELIELYGEQQITIEEHLEIMTRETYRKSADLVGSYSRLPKEEIEFIVNYPWSGAEFSDNLWHNKNLLVTNLRREVTRGLISGDSVQQMARRLRDQTDSSYYASERIIRTETGHVMNQATKKGYEDNDLERYEFIAEIDNRTSEICKQKNGNVYKLKDAVIGTNFPPMHPNCRSAIMPVVDDLVD